MEQPASNDPCSTSKLGYNSNLLDHSKLSKTKQQRLLPMRIKNHGGFVATTHHIHVRYFTETEFRVLHHDASFQF